MKTVAPLGQPLLAVSEGNAVIPWAEGRVAAQVLLRSLQLPDFARTLRHPVVGVMTLDNLIHHYAWHGRHHVAQITELRQREGWN